MFHTYGSHHKCLVPQREAVSFVRGARRRAGSACLWGFSGGFGVRVIDMSHLPRGVVGRLVGNGMSVPCVGAVLACVSAWLEFDLGTIPSHVNISVPEPGRQYEDATEVTNRARSLPPRCAFVAAVVELSPTLETSASGFLSEWTGTLQEYPPLAARFHRHER